MCHEQGKLDAIDAFDGKVPALSRVVFDEEEKVGMSKIQRADKLVANWEEILECNKKDNPSALGVVEEQLRAAKEARAKLDDTLEENTRVG